MTKQEILDYIHDNFPLNKASCKMKRIVMATYTGKYIIFKYEKIKVTKKSLIDLYSRLKSLREYS